MNTILRGQSTHYAYIVHSKGASQLWISWPGDIGLFDFAQHQFTTVSERDVQHTSHELALR